MPLLNAQYVPETGNSLRLTFDTPVVGVDPAEYAIDSLIAHALSNPVQSGTPYEWFMTIDPPLYQSEVATLAYFGTGTQDTGDTPEPLAPFSGAPIDNQSAVQPPDTTPPATPTGLTATAGNAQVTLNWDANAEGDLAGYFLQRADAGEGPYVLVIFTSDTTYTDTGLTNGQTYYWVLNALDSSNNQSAACTPVAATPVAADDTPRPVHPTTLSIGLGMGL